MEVAKQSPFDYAVVMDVIKGFMPWDETLRSCRFVNKAWLKNFNRKALIKSTFIGLERIAFTNTGSFGFSTFTVEEEEETILKIQRLKIVDKVELLQHENVVKFFEMNGNELKFIGFQAAKNDNITLVHLQFIENLLYAWCPQLEELELVGLYENDVTGPLLEQEVNNISLKKLVLNYGVSNAPSSTLRMSVVQKLLEHAKDLESLVFIGRQFDPCLRFISSEIVSLICDKTRNLTTLELYDVLVGEEEITSMTRAGWQLKKFIFQGLPEPNLLVGHLNSFLEVYAPSLEHFHLKLHWITSFRDVLLELGVHMLPNLKVLKIAVRNVKVGVSGLLGNLENLQHITLWGSTELMGSERVSLETMFARKMSTSIRSLCLDQTYVHEISSLANCCPFVSELEIEFSVMKINEFLDNLIELISTQNVLKDLKVTVHFSAFEVHNDDHIKTLVTGLLGHKFNTLKIAAIDNLDNFPWIRLAWIEEGLSANENTFFLIELEGFCIRDEEVEGIAVALTRKTNFTTLVDCKVVGMTTSGVIRLKSTTFYPDNVKTLSSDILKSVREKDKINSKLNADARNIKIW